MKGRLESRVDKLEETAHPERPASIRITWHCTDEPDRPKRRKRIWLDWDNLDADGNPTTVIPDSFVFDDPDG